MEFEQKLACNHLKSLINYMIMAVLIPVQNQKLSSKDLYELLKELAQESHVTINAVYTGLT